MSETMKAVIAFFAFFAVLFLVAGKNPDEYTPIPEISLKIRNNSYDFVNRQAYGDMYLVKSAVEDCKGDTCYQEHTVKLFSLKKNVETNDVVEKVQVSTQIIPASTTSSSTFIGKMLINDYRYYYEYYVEDGKSYKAVNNQPVTMRYFPNKHLLQGHYGVQFDSDSCFKGKVNIFRGGSVTENAKVHGHKVRVYFQVGINGESPENFTTIMNIDVDSISENITFVNTPLRECNYISFYQVTDIEIES